jgi:hypothetical protein
VRQKSQFVTGTILTKAPTLVYIDAYIEIVVITQLRLIKLIHHWWGEGLTKGFPR